MATKRKVIRTDGTMDSTTLTAGRQIVGPREWIEARERRFRLDGCMNYERCLLLSASVRWDGFTCRGCYHACGEWLPYIQATGAAYRNRRKVTMCRKHGTPMQQPKDSGKPRSHSTCPICIQEALEKRWSPRARKRQSNKMRHRWTPARRAKQAEWMREYNERTKVAG